MHASARALAATLSALVLSSCSLMGGDPSSPETSAADGGSGTTGGTVVLATHESFHLPKKLVRQFEQESGYTLEVRAAGDAGTLATKLSLTADNPIADAAFGIDNTFASRPLDEGAFAPFTPTAAPRSPSMTAVARPMPRLAPVMRTTRWVASIERGSGVKEGRTGEATIAAR